MAASDFNYPTYPISGADIPYKNTSGAAITAGQLLKLDTGNLLSGSQQQVGCVLTSAVADFPLGFAVDNTPANGQGRVRLEGVTVGIAAGAISAGAIVGASAATAGDVTTYTAANPAIGQALTAAASLADPILVRIAPCKNA